jgi:phosphoglycerol transferase MdoB-like AlkP superfamily enzyme
VNYLNPLNVKIIEQTESRLQFAFAGNFLRSTHPISWVAFGEMTVMQKPEYSNQVQITVQLNLRKIKRFLFFFPLIFCIALTGLVYLFLGTSITEILQALGWMYLMFILGMAAGYIFVKQIVRRYFTTLCESLQTPEVAR